MQYLVNTTVDTTGSASSAFALCRSPTYPVWGTVNITSPTLIVSTIELMMKDIAGGGDYVFPNVFETWSGAPSSSYPLGYGGQRSWAYHPDAGVSALRATFEPTLSETRLRITYELWTADGVDTLTKETSALPAGTTEVVLELLTTVGGFWRPVALASDNTSLSNVSLSLAWYTGGTYAAPTVPAGGLRVFRPLFSAPEFNTTTLPYEDVRCTAASLLLTNVTKVLNKEGTVLAARLNNASTPGVGGSMFNPSVSMLDNVHPSEKYFGPLERGVYAFSLPDAESSNFAPALLAPSGASKVPIFDLDHFSYYTLIFLSDPDTTTPSSFALTVDWHTEFRSQSILFPRGFSAVTLESFHGAQMALAQMPTIFENPVHLRSIVAAVSKAVKAVAPIVAPHALAAARSVGNMLLSSASKRVSTAMPQASLQPPKPKRGPQKRGKKVSVKRK